MSINSSVQFSPTEADPIWDKLIATIQAFETEPIISRDFVESLLKTLGFTSQEWFPQFPTNQGKKPVDYAVRKYNDGDQDYFKQSKKDPELLIEVKGRQTIAGALINLATGNPQYRQAKAQITGYLLSDNCKTAQWGIITNGTHIQLFRRHGKVVFPATDNYLVKTNNIHAIVSQFKQLIHNPPRALSVCVYNDKGGVGKTTTVANLAAILGLFKKKVLVVDFDANQRDLTEILGIQEQARQVKLSDVLIDPKKNIQAAIQPFIIKFKGQTISLFDIIPSDNELEKIPQDKLQQIIQGYSYRLKKIIEPLLNNYDYIIFDCPTNWTFFSQSCIYASDVVLIPTQHNNFASLKNAKKVIQEYIPEIQNHKKQKNEYGITNALPIFFNDHKQTDASIQRTYYEIQNLLKIGVKDEKIVLDPELTPYFYPKTRNGIIDKEVFNVPHYAIIAIAGFNRIPAALTHKFASESYLKLAQEYFLS